MAYSEAVTRAYVESRFPRGTAHEREMLIQDWLTKPQQAEGIAQDFERRIKPLAGLRVLDVGSGNGGISIGFAKHGAQMEGVDIEEELVAIARAEAKEQESSANFTLYNGTTLPFPENYFDAAVSVSVLEHVTEPVNYLSEVLRVLKPGGVLYLAFPNRLRFKETHTGLWGLSYLPIALGRLYARYSGHNPLEDNNLHFYTYWSGLRMIRKSARKDRAWTIRKEEGASMNPIKRVVKKILRALGLPHQAFLPHVMLVLEVTPKA
jgi:2-polyprenyl-3-methyl-5-hydroxy-6-metoxy-1,4-benzoquinol methylase